MNRPIGGSLDVGSLAKLNASAHTQQLAHARHHAKSALSALRAVDQSGLAAGEYEQLSRTSAALADAVDELDRIARAAQVAL